MIGGVHTILYSKQAEAVRAFFRDVLEFPCVDAGHGWLIFAAPPGEIAVHPTTEEKGHHELYLVCADIKATAEKLMKKGVECSPVSEQPWGLLIEVKLPDDESIGLYEPKHPMAIRMSAARRTVSKRSSRKKTKPVRRQNRERKKSR